MTRPSFAACLFWCGLTHATPQTVADSACPKYAVDIAAFATCEGDRVVTPDDEVPLRPLVDDDGFALPTNPAAMPRDPRSRSSAGLYLTPMEARTFKRWLGDRVMFVDVRASATVGAKGLAEAADVNIPLEVNTTGFGQQVARQLANQRAGSDRLIFLICGMAGLPRAADLLASAGLPRAYVVRGGVGDVDGLEREARLEELAMAH